MAEIVNLRMRRKQDKRRREDEAAAANRLAHGIGKAERNAAQQTRDKAGRDLDQHRRDRDE